MTPMSTPLRIALTVAVGTALGCSAIYDTDKYRKPQEGEPDAGRDGGEEEDAGPLVDGEVPRDSRPEGDADLPTDGGSGCDDDYEPNETEAGAYTLAMMHADPESTFYGRASLEIPDDVDMWRVHVVDAVANPAPGANVWITAGNFLGYDVDVQVDFICTSFPVSCRAGEQSRPEPGRGRCEVNSRPDSVVNLGALVDCTEFDMVIRMAGNGAPACVDTFIQIDISENI